MTKLDLLYYSVIVGTFAVTLLFGNWYYNRTHQFLSACVTIFLINALFLGLGAYWWFGVAPDGLSQYLGVYFYLFSGVVIVLINCLVLFLKNRKAVRHS